MLLRFEASNHRSIFEPIEMSMFAVDEDREEARSVNGVNGRVVTVAGIYGPNASGKSNVLDALRWLSDAVNDSFRIWEDEIPREAFLFKSGYSTSSNFNVDIVENGHSYSYEVEVNEDEVLYESCHTNIFEKPVRLFVREKDRFELHQSTEADADITKFLTSTTLLLAIIRRLSTKSRPEGSSARRVANSLSKFSFQFPRNDRRPFYRPQPLGDRLQVLVDETHPLNLRRMENSDKYREEFSLERDRAIRLIQLADLGIDDIQIHETFDDFRERVVKKMHFVHTTNEEAIPFDSSDESSGTLTWTRLIPTVLSALQNGRVLVIDELDASLHPRLTSNLVKMFQDPVDNPKNAQLIFSAHDVSLLNHLNRDEVWLTSKDEGGSTDLVAIAEFQGEDIAKSLHLESSYLMGRFGAVPKIDRYLMRTISQSS